MGCPTVLKPSASEAEQLAGRKAAKRAAKLAASVDADAVESERTEEEKRIAMKAAKKAARLHPPPPTTGDADTSAEAETKAARKAAKKAAKLAAQSGADAVEVEETEEEKKAARKAAKKAARLAAAADATMAESPAATADVDVKKAAAGQQSGVKRKLGERDAADSDSTAASAADQKRKIDAEGTQVGTKVLGAAAYRKAHQIVADARCPDPMETFDAASPALGSSLTKALLAQKYLAPTPIQGQGWPIALQGNDMVSVAKTGSGKTCGFLLPALARIAQRGAKPRRSGFCRDPANPEVLVLAPTRELAQQIAVEADKFARAAGARVVVLYGGAPKGDQVRELKAGADIVIATPGRLLDLGVGATERGYTPAITLSNVSYLVLDEADRMLDMGFEPDIRKICDNCKPSGKAEEAFCASGPLAATKRQTLFFTATWPKAVQRTARSLTSNDAVQISIGQGEEGGQLSANPMVKQTVLMLSWHEKQAKLHEVIKAELGLGQTCLVFCGQKNVCDTIEQDIKRNHDYGFKPWCRVIHSGRDQWEREEALKQFRDVTAAKGDQRAVLVATDVAARGLDIPGVAMVIVFDFGKSKHNDGTSVESYVHRIGRTGRAGTTGKAWAFFTDSDSGAPQLVEVLEGAGQVVPPALKALGDAEWYKNMERENRKNRYKKGGKGGGKGFGKGGKDGKGKGKDSGKSSGGRGCGKGGGKSFGGRGGGK